MRNDLFFIILIFKFINESIILRRFCFTNLIIILKIVRIKKDQDDVYLCTIFDQIKVFQRKKCNLSFFSSKFINK